jgi:hypothetical protein
MKKEILPIWRNTGGHKEHPKWKTLSTKQKRRATRMATTMIKMDNFFIEWERDHGKDSAMAVAVANAVNNLSRLAILLICCIFV